MNRPVLYLPGVLMAALLAGCAGLEPTMPEAQPALPAEWPLPAHTTTPQDPAGADDTAAARPVADIGWQDFYADPALAVLVNRALEHNRDLRVAVLNVERARAQYRIRRADRLPSVGVGASLQRTGGDAPLVDQYSVELGVTGFELDLFGRVRNLSQADLQRYFATEEARRSAQLALVAEVATVYFTLAADRDQLQIAQQTLANHGESFRLTEQRHALGAVSGLDVGQARTAVESARADVAFYRGLVAQDINALRLLAGSALDTRLLPDSLEPLTGGVAAVPAGLPSEALLRRPDVMAAEHRLRAANADIGAARAAYFPSISLTGAIGTASDELSGLFASGSDYWTFIPQVRIPIFQGGRLRAGVDAAVAGRDIRLAEYEQAIQAGFREVADGLALSRTLREQRRAQQALLEAATQVHDLSSARYEAGQDSFLALLDAQRGLYAARQGMTATLLAEQVNRVALYKALGGGWAATETRE